MHISQGADLMQREAQPQPTDLPLTSPPEAADVLDQLAKRQLTPTATCGWMQFGTQWEAWGCVSQTTCKTINNKYFGCFDTIYTTCLPSTICANAATVADRDLCCERSSFIECITGYRTAGDVELTGYRCAVPSVRGDLSVYENSFVPGASTSSSTTPAPTDPSSTEPRTTTITPTTTATDPPDSGSGTPVGAIVGGVIGGVALIALIGIAVFFIMRKKKNQQQQPQPVPQQPPPPMEYQGQTPYQTPYQQQPTYPAYPSGVPTSPPPPMSPPPESAHGYQPTPDNSGYGGKYDTSRSPVVAHEMPIDNPRNDRPPVELQ